MPGDELLEPVDRPELDVHPGGGEEDPVDIDGARVRHGVVDRLTLAIEGMELFLRPCERPPGARDPFPGGLGLDVDHHRERGGSEGVPRPPREDRTSPERQDGGLASSEEVQRDLLLGLTETGFAARGKELGHTRAGPPFDLPVEVDERATEPHCDLCSEPGLSGPHEPGKGEVPAERVQVRGRHRSPIRARYVSCAASTSTSASPPSFSSAARASSNATAASETTARASTACTSERSTSAWAGSPVSRSTESSGRMRVGSGFMAARTTIGS